jgi:hypothetical protein
MIKRLIFSLLITAYLPVVSSATIIHVPADFPTIQAAIDSTSNGDTVMVAPGTYTGGGNQNISTGGKAITVTTSGGPLVTVIDGSIIERGFDINGGEDSTTILEGFTIFNSYCGVYCDSSAPTVRNMIIKDFLNYGIHFDGFLADPPIAPVVENCLIFQESGCLFQDLTYGLEFHTIDNRPPNFNIDKCIIRNNVVDGLWAHS